eukprot:COSAG04_NODE_14825_length_553_cov_11.726872_2_plen_52_part_01
MLRHVFALRPASLHSLRRTLAVARASIWRPSFYMEPKPWSDGKLGGDSDDVS